MLVDGGGAAQLIALPQQQVMAFSAIDQLLQRPMAQRRIGVRLLNKFQQNDTNFARTADVILTFIPLFFLFKTETLNRETLYYTAWSCYDQLIRDASIIISHVLHFEVGQWLLIPSSQAPESSPTVSGISASETELAG